MTTVEQHTATDPKTLEPLWQPVRAGDLQLPHRLAMAPMTRSRVPNGGAPTEMNARYYAQRASNALIISEGTQPSEDGQGYIDTPGIHSEQHKDGWRIVTDAVHHAGGRIVIQLMHVGRIAHPDNTAHGRQPVAPSAVRADVNMFTATGLQPVPEPRALTTDEVRGVVDEFRGAAKAAVEAGADGVEIHSANGYLLHQFLSSNANQRTDEYGGSIDNRIRMSVEVAAAVADEIGAGRTGIRISPGNPLADIVEDDVAELYPALVSALDRLGLGYLHIAGRDDALLTELRRRWSGTLLLNRPGADIATRAHDIARGLADVVTVGAMNLANPDLMDRLRLGVELNSPDRATFYGGNERGYLDYPTLHDRNLN